MRVYYWIHHTGRYAGNSGVQRVVRLLARALVENGVELIPVRWNSGREEIVVAEQEWLDGLALHGGPRIGPQPSAGQPLHIAFGGQLLRDHWLLIPEVTHLGDPQLSLAVALDYARYYGLRSAAVFYDLIPIRVPGYEAMADVHARYVKALVAADLILPISQHSGRDLTEWWREEQYFPSRLPRVESLLLPHEMRDHPRVTGAAEPGDGQIRFVSVGSIDPRKNQVRLCRAFRRLAERRPDLDLKLQLIGGLHPAVASEIADLQSALGARLEVSPALGDEEMVKAVRESHATVFVSLNEGYGLPVAESLWLGAPSICSGFGSMAEIAAGGGCLTIDSSDQAAIEEALERIASDTGLRAQLAEVARNRPLETWSNYAGRVLEALEATPLLPEVLCVEGTRGGGLRAATSLGRHTRVRPFRWRSDSRSIIPGFEGSAVVSAAGDGLIGGGWAVLDLATTLNTSEAEAVIAACRSLKLRVLVQFEPGKPFGDAEAALAANADIALFPDEAAREQALAWALRRLSRTTNLRRRFQAGTLDSGVRFMHAERPAISMAGATRLPSRAYLWVDLTVTQPFNTGIQRVARCLAAGLQQIGVEVVLVKKGADGRIAPVSGDEALHFARWGGASTAPPPALPAALRDEWLIIPELTIPMPEAGEDAAALARARGMKVAAIFYDLIPTKMPELYPPVMHEHLARYWSMLAGADVVLPISWSVVCDFSQWVADHQLSLPQIVPCPLGGNIPGMARQRLRAPPGESERRELRLIGVGTWEPRKNYPRVLRALEEARRLSGCDIRLTIVGRRAHYEDLNNEIRAIADRLGDAVVLLDHLSDEELVAEYERADASIYASYEEGFGLPVLESLWRGVPAICHSGSSLAEVAPGGGVVTVNMEDESAIAAVLANLARAPEGMAGLRLEVADRHVRTWAEYAEDVRVALAGAGAPGWPLPAIVTRAPLLSCCITTYNRAPWLRHSLANLLEVTRPWRDVVEVVVCDNASTDDTRQVMEAYAGEPGVICRTNPENVGMLGNLGETVRASSGAFVWLLGDDDVLLKRGLEDVLAGIADHPDVEMAYANYSYTSFDAPSELADIKDLLNTAKPIGAGGASRYVKQLRDISPLNENLFTAIYACAFRRDHAMRAYQQDVRGAPFSSLLTCIPSSVYALSALQDRPAWWVGDPAVVVNMNVSWLRWALLWHLERMPDLFDLAEWHGVDKLMLDRFRAQHAHSVAQWAEATWNRAEDAIREGFSLARSLERCKHLPGYSRREVPKLRQIANRAWTDGRVLADHLPPHEIFFAYGLEA